jgi:hypothetical protein
MTVQIIRTSQAPDAKPIGFSKTLTTDWETIIEVPSFEVPEESFGGGSVVVPGVAELISPMLVCNTTSSTSRLSIRVYRLETDTNFLITNELPIPSNDIVSIPLNGQFIYSGDLVQVKGSDNNTLDITLSYTIGQAEEDDVA